MRGWIQQRFWPVAKETWSGWSKHDGSLLSAATAYYAAFSLFPLCVVLVAALGVVGRYSDFLQSQQARVGQGDQNNMGHWLAEPGRRHPCRRAGAGGRERAVGAGDPDRRGHRHLHATGEHVRPHLGHARGDAAHLAGRNPRGPVGPAAGVPDAVGHRGVVVRLVPGRRGALERALACWSTCRPGDWAGTWCSGWRAWADRHCCSALYKVLPKARVPWKYALRGGLLAAVAWAVGQRVLLTMVVGESYSAYGVLGVLIGLMFWFYYASAAVFLGAEFARASAQCANAVKRRLNWSDPYDAIPTRQTRRASFQLAAVYE